ncbi:guanine nucleotide exchange factor C9orf72 [Patella vulgata]|uniref:guanine nucleotide exchange factor C9orf72 n=1 Tax=Patella vulgata TaxID=6465 RepID=UPI0021807B3E|nr:guanine nucleotide exchange factor C9orf72 [Patella vulgata]
MDNSKSSRRLRLTSRNDQVGIMKFSSETITCQNPGSNDSTPLSPSSMFTSTELKYIKHSFINAILLCHWDNILGPRLYHLWKIQNVSPPPVGVLRFLTGQILSGEICKELDSNSIDFKFYDMPDKLILVAAFVFSGQLDRDVAIQSVGFVIPNSELNLYLKYHNLLQLCFRRLISKFRILLNKVSRPEDVLNKFSSWLTICLEMFSSLTEAGLPQQPRLSETAFCPHHNLEPDFLYRCITSHLMTFGRSLVVGKLAERVNLVISTLALFNTDNERATSRLVDDDKPWSYHHDLCVQGLLKSHHGAITLPIREILCSRYPTTIIDVQNRDVKHSPYCYGHDVKNFQVLRDELLYLHQNNMDEPDMSNSVFQKVHHSSYLVSTLIDEISKLSADCGIRVAHVQQFMRLLNRRAFSLINYVETETLKGSISLKGGLKKLRQDLSLIKDGDFRIILATAEKCKPGIYHFLLGEGKHVDFVAPMGEII